MTGIGKIFPPGRRSIRFARTGGCACLLATNLVGPPRYVRERVDAYRAAGVTSLLGTLDAADRAVTGRASPR